MRTMVGNNGIKRMILSIDNVLLAAYERGLARPNSGFQRELQFRVSFGVEVSRPRTRCLSTILQ